MDFDVIQFKLKKNFVFYFKRENSDLILHIKII